MAQHGTVLADTPSERATEDSLKNVQQMDSIESFSVEDSSKSDDIDPKAGRRVTFVDVQFQMARDA